MSNGEVVGDQMDCENVVRDSIENEMRSDDCYEAASMGVRLIGASPGGTNACSTRDLRRELYIGRGFCVFRSFLSPAQTQNIWRYWEKHQNVERRSYDKHRDLRSGCSDFSTRESGVVRHHNFFWNRPLHEFTYETAWKLQLLRNELEGRSAHREFLPHYEASGFPDHYCVSSYRVTLTSRGGSVPVHADWPQDPSRLQMSLMLTSYGDDYTGGFSFAKERGEEDVYPLGEALKLRAGDLVVFRYIEMHGVDDVKEVPGGRGFCRLLMPNEFVPKRPGGIRRLVAALPKGRLGQVGARLLLRKGRVDAAQTSAVVSDQFVGRLQEIAVDEGLSPADVYAPRGLWGRFRQFDDWQVDTLKSFGLRPEHQVLDIGCGVMRLGMRLIEFLDDDHYAGIDPLPDYIRVSKRYLKEVIESEKTCQLVCDGDFRFDVFNRKFDFAIAHSVFTHLSFADIERCLKSLKQVMSPGGRLLFTFCLGEDREFDVVYSKGVPMTKSHHVDTKRYESLAESVGFRFDFHGRSGHPTQFLGSAVFE